MPLSSDVLKGALQHCWGGVEPSMVPQGTDLYRGKVRDVIRLRDKLILSVSDRISAFDRVLSTIPFKGEVLNRISLYWFEKTADIIPNHIIKPLSGRMVLARRCSILPIEVVIRGYLTGSAWRDYQAGRAVSGIQLPQGLSQNQAFAEPLITPSTKESDGGHDQPISPDEIVARGLVPAETWRQVERAARALFTRGTELAASRGLILVDTKYEFGLVDGQIILADEIHTPDSSRYWYRDDYDAALAENRTPRQLDKEFFRQWLMAQGFSGDGASPHIPDDIRIQTAMRYIDAFEQICGENFVPDAKITEQECELLLSIIRHEDTP